MTRARHLHLMSWAFALLAASVLAVPAQAGVTFVINNIDGPGVGFNDATAVAPVGGNPGTTLGAQRLNAFQFAADLWGSILDSNVTVVIQSTFFPAGTSNGPLACTPTAAVLGAAGTIQIFANFPGAGFANTWYHSSLANKLAGVDLSPARSTPAGCCRRSTTTSSPCSTTASTTPSAWAPGAGTTASTTSMASTSRWCTCCCTSSGTAWASPTSSTRRPAPAPSVCPTSTRTFTRDNTTGLNWNVMTVPQIQTSARNCDNVVWSGPNVTANVPLFIGKGLPSATVNSPASIAGPHRVGAAAFGPLLSSPGVTGNVVQALDPSDPAGLSTTDGCSPLTNAAAVNNNIAIIDRGGTCGFVVKVANAQAAGATAVLIADNVAGCPAGGMAGVDPTIIIPSARLTLADGNAVKSNLPGVNVTLGVNLARFAGADTSGRAQVFAANPVQPGSSISHFDTVAFPNLLMEPAINADLVKNQVDLTPWLLIDEGWSFANVIIDGCDTGVPNFPVPGDGTIGTTIDDCAAGAGNHGQFVSCVSHAMNALKKAGIISGSQKGAIQSCAGGAAIP